MTRQPTHAAIGPGQERLLDTLRRRGPQTAHEIAEHTGLTAVGIRAHLRTLLAGGLVAHEEERQSTGRPVRRYHLTASADTHFAKHYDALALHLCDAVGEEFGAEGFRRILERWEKALGDYLQNFVHQKAASPLKVLAEHQSRHDFMAEINDAPGETQLVERNCPIAKVAQAHPEICAAEARVFAQALGEPVVLRGCQARGADRCTFAIKPKKR